MVDWELASGTGVDGVIMNGNDLKYLTEMAGLSQEFLDYLYTLSKAELIALVIEYDIINRRVYNRV
jgi:hypothetical protein